ncbi:MAG: septum formation protein Maf [Ignavibacteriales bacterium]|nr:septum formation protein Maf [Ignavibacteriales bacterium]
MIIKKNIILASKSPRRQNLLKQIGLDFKVIESGINEELSDIKTPIEHVLELSKQKAKEVAKKIDNALIIGADTIVYIDGKILGKPSDEKDAVQMLNRLSGQTHQVYTGFTLLDVPSQKILSDYEKTEVTFRNLSKEEIEKYVKSGSPMDKAGAYGIQDDYGAVFVQNINGCFYNVVGFPLTKFYLAMESFQKGM